MGKVWQAGGACRDVACYVWELRELGKLGKLGELGKQRELGKLGESV